MSESKVISQKSEIFMKHVIELALRAKGVTSPNPIVGAVIVKNNKIIAEGYHHKAGSAHAEIEAIKQAKGDLTGATLYVNLEPCNHFGRTPPCVDAVIESGIKEVVIGMKDPNLLTNGKSILKLKRAGIKVSVGILEKECQKINEVFSKYISTKMPFVAIKSAQSLDGKIATAKGQSKWITSEETRAYARRIRDEFDAILVGVNTVLKDDPGLTGVRKENLFKIIVDSKLKSPFKATVFQNPRTCIVATTALASKAKIKLMEKRGVQVLVCPLKAQKVDLKWLFKELAKKEITSILMEGGAKIIGEALKLGLVDKAYIYIAPKILGDQNALSAVNGLNIKDVNSSIQLKSLVIKNLNPDILITAYVHRNR